MGLGAIAAAAAARDTGPETAGLQVKPGMKFCRNLLSPREKSCQMERGAEERMAKVGAEGGSHIL